MNTEPVERLTLKDKQIECVDCGCEFVFSVGEQKYFLSKSLSEPKRCARCRLKRKLSLVPDGEVQR